jgi:Stress responsive A/B Barrel Domain
VIAHIVLFTPKPGLDHEVFRSFTRLLREACGGIPAVARSIVGRAIDVDPGYTRMFGDKTYEFAAVFEFADRASLVAYLNHPIHQRLGRAFWDTCESTVISEVEFIDGSNHGLEDLLGR